MNLAQFLLKGNGQGSGESPTSSPATANAAPERQSQRLHGARYATEGRITRLFDGHCPDLHPKLRPGIYAVSRHPMTGEFFLEFDRDRFSMPDRLFGNISARSEKILKTFWSRNKSTGVFLCGEKGCGKTLLAKSIANNSNLPVILIDAPYRGPAFNKFIASLDEEAVIFFDEFEKIYAPTEDEPNPTAPLLSLFDGVFSKRKLFLMTANTNKLDPNMIERPGRIYYSIEYKCLDKESIRDYLNIYLDNKDHIKDVLDLVDFGKQFNFDLLATLVEEMNRFDETVYEAMETLNISKKIPRARFNVKTRCYSSEDKYEEVVKKGISLSLDAGFRLPVRYLTEDELEKEWSKHRRRHKKDNPKITSSELNFLRNRLEEDLRWNSAFLPKHYVGSKDGELFFERVEEFPEGLERKVVVVLSPDQEEEEVTMLSANGGRATLHYHHEV